MEIIRHSITPTISATPDYASGDAIGTATQMMPFPSWGGVLTSIQLRDGANQGPAMKILIFDQEPTAATITDNAAFAISTDLTNVIAEFLILAADWDTIDSEKVVNLSDLRNSLRAAGGSRPWVLFVANGAYNAGSTSDLTAEFFTEVY